MADCSGTNDRGTDDEARLRRLAIVLAAQLPGDPKRASLVLGYIRELVTSCGAQTTSNFNHCTSPGKFCWFDRRQ